jgi:hypothetical protein
MEAHEADTEHADCGRFGHHHQSDVVDEAAEGVLTGIGKERNGGEASVSAVTTSEVVVRSSNFRVAVCPATPPVYGGAPHAHGT